MKRLFITLVTLALAFAASLATAADETNAAAQAVTNAVTNAIVNTAANANTNPESGLDLSSFQIISTRNIFNPDRRPNTPGSRGGDSGPAHRYESFKLTGTMSYEDKSYAFFDGSGSQYRNRAFAPAETINGYKIAEIANNYVKLMAASNQTINLSVGMQMMRTDNGPWALVARADLTAELPSPGAEGSAPRVEPMVSGADSDVIRRLMLKREQEMNGTNATNENHQ